MSNLNILLCSEKMELVKSFYEAVGVACVEEQHGAGPIHFALQGEFSAMEIYPPRSHSHANIVLRIDVENVDASMNAVADKFSLTDLVIEPAQDLKTGRKAVLHDPDGRVVELFQPFKPN